MNFQYAMLCLDMASYDDFAWFYDRYWNDEFHSVAFPILERIWLTRLQHKARILDVCCGTGYLAGLLAARGHSVTGVDVSAQMIRYARRNVPSAEFHGANIVHFQPGDGFDGAVSTFDSLNHILEPPELQLAFENVGAAVRKGGLFVFDMLLERAYQTHWGEGFAIVRDDHVLTITGSRYDFRSRLAECDITMFRRQRGVWRRCDVKIVERCYTVEEIETGLSRAGFGELICYHAGDLGMGGQLGEGRTFFVATKL